MEWDFITQLAPTGVLPLAFLGFVETPPALQGKAGGYPSACLVAPSAWPSHGTPRSTSGPPCRVWAGCLGFVPLGKGGPWLQIWDLHPPHSCGSPMLEDGKKQSRWIRVTFWFSPWQKNTHHSLMQMLGVVQVTSAQIPKPKPWKIFSLHNEIFHLVKSGSRLRQSNRIATWWLTFWRMVSCWM